MSITVSFVTCADPLSALIREKSPLASHVEFLLADGRRLGAHFGGGIEARPGDYQTFTAEWRAMLEAPDDVEVEALKYVGTPYDWEAIIGFVVERPLTESAHLICSAFVTKVLLDKGVFRPIPQPVSEIDPHSCMMIASQHAQVVRVR